jgi:hypothetical protein
VIGQAVFWCVAGGLDHRLSILACGHQLKQLPRAWRTPDPDRVADRPELRRHLAADHECPCPAAIIDGDAGRAGFFVALLPAGDQLRVEARFGRQGQPAG